MKYSAEFSNNFKKNYKKIKKQDLKIEKDFELTLKILLNGESLPVKYKDHKLKGDLEGFYDYHLRYDVVVIRCYIKNNTLRFVDIGAHKDIFGN